MTDRSHSGGLLDLGDVEAAPLKVRLPSGGVYDLADPESLGARQLQRVMSRQARARELMGKPDATDDDVVEMMELLVDVACVILPDAPRDDVAELSMRKLQRLTRAFSDASPADPAGEATTATSAT